LKAGGEWLVSNLHVLADGWRLAAASRERIANSAEEYKMHNTNLQWALWAIAMVVFFVLTLTGHTILLGLTITAVAVFWYSVVPKVRSRRQ